LKRAGTDLHQPGQLKSSKKKGKKQGERLGKKKPSSLIKKKNRDASWSRALGRQVERDCRKNPMKRRGTRPSIKKGTLGGDN